MQIAIRGLLTFLLALVACMSDVSAEAVDQAERLRTTALLDRALAMAEDSQWDEAEATIAETENTLLIRFMRWKRLADDDSGLDLANYLDYLETGSDWPSTDRIRKRAESLLDPSIVAPVHLGLFKDHEPQTTEGRISLARAFEAAGESEKAAELARRIWVEDDFARGDQRFFLSLFRQYLSKQDHIDRLDRLTWQGREDSAKRMFPLVDDGQRALAQARVDLRQLRPGVDYAIRRVPSDLRDHPGLIFERSRWRRLKNRNDEARALLEEAHDPGRGAGLFWRERQWHIRDRIEAGDFAIAYRLAAGHGQEEGVNFAEAEWLAGWMALRFLDRPETAATHFEALWANVRSPISLSRGAYWRGRAALDVGDEAAADLWFERAAGYPTTFYGQQALAELEREFALPASMKWLDGTMPQDTPNEPEPAPRSLAMAMALCKFGAADEAQTFAGHHLASYVERGRALADLTGLAERCGRPDILTGQVRRQASSGELPYLASFPIPSFPPLVDDQLPAEPALALAIARQESLFNPNAKSHSGALGLMQIIPPTGSALAGAIGETIEGNRLIIDPTFNVRLGRTYIDSLIDGFGGNTVLAIAAYNAGPSRVRQWLRVLGPFDGEDRFGWIDWIERIPFDETRNYVQRVTEGIPVYRALLERYPRGNLSFVPDNGPIKPVPAPDLRPNNSA